MSADFDIACKISKLEAALKMEFLPSDERAWIAAALLIYRQTLANLRKANQLVGNTDRLN